MFLALRTLMVELYGRGKLFYGLAQLHHFNLARAIKSSHATFSRNSYSQQRGMSPVTLKSNIATK